MSPPTPWRLDGFSVDLDALSRAADGVEGTLDQLAHRSVADIDAPPPAFGDSGLASAFTEFCGRWERGLSNLAADADEVAVRLRASVEAYWGVDGPIAERLDGVLRAQHGADPAAQ